MADGTLTLTRSPLHEAQLAYEQVQRQSSTASNQEIQSDLDSAGLMAEVIRTAVSRCWTLYRATNDDRDRREFETSEVRRMVGEVICESFGASREFAAVVDAECSK